MFWNLKNYKAIVQVSFFNSETGLSMRTENITKFAVAKTNGGAKKIVRKSVEMTPDTKFIAIIDCREYKQGLP